MHHTPGHMAHQTLDQVSDQHRGQSQACARMDSTTLGSLYVAACGHVVFVTACLACASVQMVMPLKLHRLSAVYISNLVRDVHRTVCFICCWPFQHMRTFAECSVGMHSPC